MFQHMIDDKKNNLPFKKYLDNYEEDIALIKLLITGCRPSDKNEVFEKVRYH